ncbi:MAG: hypothetical protein A2909_02750 [Candidatus Tagabacteria bacterium RIFCSPLOWO2_01_FULL_39_11]|uniref:Small ribosomal subunit protein bS6 n=1 Tax=Candidatus Tagabacteria bacterium RIFCSPLOWO2_01_FULL_39_11 TaxID=1802295 RepID=A0A1G2LRC9_9BACT|nr:MAG: hypothetical protein A2909_02750 [Candidatus Tagabacteria bacterium RIFCSPLOWO2_01_FULL_39_11]
MEQDLQLYEMGYLLKNEWSEEKLQNSATELMVKIQAHKGIIIEEINSKRCHLNYPILKNDDAFFGSIKFLCARENIKKINDDLKNNQAFIRFLIAKTGYKKPSKIKSLTPHKRKERPEEKKEQIKEIDKKLEEILGN